MISQGAISHYFGGEELLLLPERAIFLPGRKCLLVADVHLGKSGHFRKNGIPVPQQVVQTDIDRLDRLCEQFSVEQLIILGDLFHSHYNREWEAFREFCSRRGEMQVDLVLGNHDLLGQQRYLDCGLKVHRVEMELGKLLLVHEPFATSGDVPEGKFALAGHLHPGVRLNGQGRQSLRLPCFWFGERQGLMPAFGSFTGLAILQPQPSEKVFAVAEGQVLSLKN